MATEPPPQPSRLSVVTWGAAVVAILCCAGLPLLSAAVGGLTLGAVFGVGAGVLALAGALVFGLIFLRARRRRSFQSNAQR